MYEITWYVQIAIVIAGLIETFKRSGAHALRERSEKFKTAYPIVLKGLAFLIALVLCFGAKADMLITLEIEGFAPELGYVLGAVLILGGETLIDAAWDNRKLAGAIMSDLVKVKLNAPTE